MLCCALLCFGAAEADWRVHTIRQKYDDKFLCSTMQKCNRTFDTHCTRATCSNFHSNALRSAVCRLSLAHAPPTWLAGLGIPIRPDHQLGHFVWAFPQLGLQFYPQAVLWSWKNIGKKCRKANKRSRRSKTSRQPKRDRKASRVHIDSSRAGVRDLERVCLRVLA